MDLAAVVGLVLEQMRQGVVAPVVLDPLAPVDGDDFGQGFRREAVDVGDECKVGIGLPGREGRQVGAEGRLVQQGAVESAAEKRSSGRSGRP